MKSNKTERRRQERASPNQGFVSNYNGGQARGPPTWPDGSEATLIIAPARSAIGARRPLAGATSRPGGRPSSGGSVGRPDARGRLLIKISD